MSLAAAIRSWWSPDPRAELLAALGRTEIPAFRATTLSVLEALRDPDIGPAELSVLIERDPGLGLRVLRAVNSAAVGLRRQVDSIRQASMLLGRSQLELIVVAVATREALPGDQPGFDSRAFWATASRRAATARALARKLDPRSAPMAFTAGLLQNLAVPLLAEAKGAAYTELLAAHQNDRIPLERLETDVYGFEHGHVAGWVCQAWNFPDSLGQAISTHHAPEAPAAVQLVALIPEGTAEAGPTEVLVETARSRFGLCPDVVTGALAEGDTQGQEFAAVLG